MDKRKDVRVMGIGLAAGLAVLLQACGNASSTPSASSLAPTSLPVTPAVTILATTAAPEATAAEPAPASPTPALTPESIATQAATVPTVNAAAQPALQEVVNGLEKPTYLTHAGDGSGLLYITEQPGRIRVLRDGQLVETPFLDLTDQVGDSGNEQGLLSVAFSPDFEQSRKLYVNYTDTNGDTVVSGFIASADGLTADKSSEWLVIKVNQPYANHNGGQLKFGPDGMLYIGMGDGGSAGDPQNRAQDVNELLGKMLRIDVSQSSQQQPYTLPSDNPSFGNGAQREIWAMGLRNPWRFSFDRATGDMFIGDVGQNAVEEINFQPAGQGGQNYGWKLREGFEEYAGPKQEGFTDPIHQYSQSGGNGCSVTGGYMYRGTTVPSLAGSYIYGDYCSGNIWSLKPDANGQWVNNELFSADYRITSFGEDEVGELYVLDRGGAIYKLVGQ